MMAPENMERATKAHDAVELATDFKRGNGEPLQTGITDLLVNLMHLCERDGEDFDTCVEVAYRHFRAETAEF